MTLPRFNPPANAPDFSGDAALTSAWSTLISDFFNDSIAAAEDRVGQGKSQFYNPTVTDTSDPSVPKVISWIGFPKVLYKDHPGNRPAAWKAADQLRSETFGNLSIRFRRQDEYLEWHTERGADGKITRVTFTCE